MLDNGQVGSYTALDPSFKIDNHVGRKCGECGHRVKQIYRSGRYFYKCGIKCVYARGRSVKLKKDACMMFKEGEGKERFVGLGS